MRHHIACAMQRESTKTMLTSNENILPGRSPDLRAVQAGHVCRASWLCRHSTLSVYVQDGNGEANDHKPQDCRQQDVVVRFEVRLERHEAVSPAHAGCAVSRNPRDVKRTVALCFCHSSSGFRELVREGPNLARNSQ